MADRWLYGWGLASVALGGASLIVPLYVVELGGDAVVLGVLFASASFVGVPGALVFGRLADRAGRRRSSVVGAVAVTAAMLVVVPFVGSIPLVIVANAVVWFAFAAAVPVLTLLAVAGTAESEWSDRIARLNEFQGVGWALGLLVGFVVVTAGTAVADVITAQRAFFLVCAVAASLGFAITYRTLPADPAPDEVPSMRQVRRRLRPGARFNVRGSAFPFTPTRFYARRLHPRLFAERFTAPLGIYFVAVFLFFAGFGTFFAPLPAYLTETGYGSGEVFALYFVLNAGAAVFFRGAAGLVSRHEVALLHAGGLLVRGAALPAVALVGALLGDAVLGLGVASTVFVVIGLTWAVIAVAAGTLVTRLAPAGVRGEALGVYSALSVLAGGVGGVVGGWLGASSYPLAFAVAGGLVVVGAGVVLAVRASADTASAAGPESP